MTTSSIIFIDARISNSLSLIDSLMQPAEVIIIDGESDGLAQMVAALKGRNDIDAIHVISHGSQGTLYLGSTVLNERNLSLYQSQLASIGSALSETGDLLLYGCNVAQGDAGLKFIDSLAQATRADVAASDNLTGLRGDWALELAVGQIETTPMEFTGFSFTLTPTGTVSIAETTTVGQTLTAIDTLADADGLGSRTYTWQTSEDGYRWNSVSTGVNFSVIGNYVAYKIRVVASYIDLKGNAEAATSNATEPVGRRFIGTTGADALVGTVGADVFNGGSGNDTFDAGKNRTTDTAIFSGKKSDYSISFLADPYSVGSLVVTDLNIADGNDGTDTLTSIERLQFSDGAIDISYPKTFINETGYSKLGVRPAIVDLNSGHAVVAWIDINSVLWLQQLNNAGIPVGESVRTNLGGTSLSIAGFPDGGFLVASDAGSWINLQRFDSSGIATTGIFHANTTQHTYGYGDGYGPVVTRLGNGGYLVAWTHHNDTDGSGIFAQRFDSNNTPVGNEFVANSELAYNQQWPTVAGLSNGNFVIAWESTQANSYTDIRFQVFDSSGQHLGTERDATDPFRYGYQPWARSPMLAALSAGRFALSWSYNGDVYAGLFEPNYHVLIDVDSLQSSYYTFPILGWSGQTNKIAGETASGILVGQAESDSNLNYVHLIAGKTNSSPTILGTDSQDNIYLFGSNLEGAGLAGDDSYFISIFSGIRENLDGGNDSVFSSTPYTLPDNVENLTLTGSCTSGAGNKLDNILSGNSFNNWLNGAGGIDTTLYRGNKADFTISRDGEYFIVTDHNPSDVDEGQDTLYNVEFVKFADRMVNLAANATPTGSINISGALVKGHVLKASNTLADLDGLGDISYQWQCQGQNIIGATNDMFTLTQDQVDRTLTVTASYTDGVGLFESKVSEATGPVGRSTVNLLVYSWKTHTLLDGVSMGGGNYNASTGSGGDASFTAVMENTLPLNASRAIPIGEANTTSTAVNLQDAIAILKMIVGLPVNGANQALSPYQTLAADFDGNGTVGLSDAIGVLKHVVGLTAPAPSWHFVSDIDISIPGKTNLNPGIPQTTINADLRGASPVHIGLVGYLSGDVDGSYAGALGALDLDNTQPSYFTALTQSQSLNLSQFGIY